MSIRNAHVPCHYLCNSPVNFKKAPFRMSLSDALCNVVYFYYPVTSWLLDPLLHVDFKKWACRCVQFKG